MDNPAADNGRSLVLPDDLAGVTKPKQLSGDASRRNQWCNLFSLSETGQRSATKGGATHAWRFGEQPSIREPVQPPRD